MRLRAAEKFITRETGEYECRVCSYTYVPSKGDGRDFGPGTQFRDLPPGANDTRISHCARSVTRSLCCRLALPRLSVSEGRFRADDANHRGIRR